MQVLETISPFAHPWVDPTAGPMEDAAIVRPDSGSPLAFTVDFITPIVDDPETFGAIAASNAMSDIYAMGGTPQVALAICGFPEDRVPLDVVGRVFRGGRDKAAEAGCAVVGGHTVVDPEFKYGLAVIGSLGEGSTLRQDRGRPGDLLVLTKPLGCGIVAQALKKDRIDQVAARAAVAAMCALNAGAKDAALACGARAATDITGFGLLSHLHHLASASKLAARVSAGDVPRFDAVLELAAAGLVPGGTRKNLGYVEPHVRWASDVDPLERLLLCDAQTSGGLLIAIPREAADRLLAELAQRGTPARALIGELVEGEPGAIEVDG